MSAALKLLDHHLAMTHSDWAADSDGAAENIEEYHLYLKNIIHFYKSYKDGAIVLSKESTATADLTMQKQSSTCDLQTTT